MTIEGGVVYQLSCVFHRDDKSSRYHRAQRSDEVDKRYGFDKYTEPVERVGWLINIHPVSSPETHVPKS